METNLTDWCERWHPLSATSMHHCKLSIPPWGVQKRLSDADDRFRFSKVPRASVLSVRQQKRECSGICNCLKLEVKSMRQQISSPYWFHTISENFNIYRVPASKWRLKIDYAVLIQGISISAWLTWNRVVRQVELPDKCSGTCFRKRTARLRSLYLQRSKGRSIKLGDSRA